MKKVLSICNKEQILVIMGITKKLSNKHEIKSKYTALNLALDYVNGVDYLQENKDLIGEMIALSTETLVIGKYVLTFFEALLRKLYFAVSCNQEEWFGFWIDQYLRALKAGDEALRTAVCTYITPIVIRIDKISLAYILSKFLHEYKSVEQKSISTLESLMTLLKVARQNKMIYVCD